MRTNIEIDDNLLSEAMKLVNAKSKREAVDVALQELVASRERRRILEMFQSGVCDPNYDHKAARAGDLY